MVARNYNKLIKSRIDAVVFSKLNNVQKSALLNTWVFTNTDPLYNQVILDFKSDLITSA